MFDGIDNAYPLTPLQEGILYEVLKAPDTDVYVAYVLIDIHGRLNESAFKSAWQSTLHRYETLRTRFVWEGMDEPLQLVNSQMHLQWESVSAQGDTDTVMRQWLAHERCQRLSLTEHPPLRFRLVRFSGDHAVLVWVVHHLLADDWSTPIVLSAVVDEYTSLCRSNADHHSKLMTTISNGSDIATDSKTGRHTSSTANDVSAEYSFVYEDYVSWLQATEQSNSIQWWQQALATVMPSPMSFRVSAPALPETLPDAQAWRSICHPRVKCQLSVEDASSVAAFAAAAGVTQSSLFHAVWTLCVSHFTGTHQPVFGTSVSGRTCPLSGIETAVGLFLNTLPTCIPIDPQLSTEAFVQSVQARLFEQMSHEHVPLSIMQGMNPMGKSEPWFDSVLVVESHGTELNLASAPVDHPQSIRFGSIRYETDSNYPLTVLVFPAAQPEVHLLARADFIDEEYVPLLADTFIRLLKQLCSGQCTTVACVLQQAHERSDNVYQSPRQIAKPVFSSVGKWIVDTAAKNPTQIAVTQANEQLAYGELINRASLLCPEIQNRSTQGECIGVTMGRSIEQIIAILAIMLSGRTYLALDMQWPVERIRYMVKAADVQLLLTRKEEASQIEGWGGDVIVVTASSHTNENAQLKLVNTNEFESTCADIADGTAYMMFTSGSTGSPKAVPVSNRNLLYSTTARLSFYPHNPQAFLLLSSMAFDSSVVGVFWTLCTGGTLVLPSDGQASDVHELTQLINKNEVSHTLCLPSLYTLLLQYAQRNDLQSLNTVIVAGEACSSHLPTLHRKHLPNTLLFNEYGPTEATVWASASLLCGSETMADESSSAAELVAFEQTSESAHRSALSNSEVSIGQPIPGSRISIENNLGQRCLPGIVGEIVISGPGVVAGYLNDDGKNRLSFQTNTYFDSDWGACASYRSGDKGVMGADGNLYFLGRIDDQVKIRGNRVEPAEVTWRVQSLDGVVEAHCVAHSAAGATPQLYCYVVPEGLQESGICRLLAGDEVDEQMRPITEAALKRVASELPSYFLVSRFVAVSALPRLPNGKINNAGFPTLAGETDKDAQLGNEQPVKQDLQKDQAKSAYKVTAADGSVQAAQSDAPPDTTTGLLCRSLETLLNVTNVGPEDNFFNLGGDSLSAIRFVAHCREQGLSMTIPMVSSHATLATLGAALDKDLMSQSRVSTDMGNDTSTVAPYGELPLTPIQQWFFDQSMPRPAHWNMAFIVTLQDAVETHLVVSAVKALLESLPVLFTQFSQVNGQWRGNIPQQIVSCHSIQVVNTPSGIERWTDQLIKVQTSFSLEQGQLVKSLIGEDANKDSTQSIGVVVHHLVTDALSNQYLAERLQKAVDNVSSKAASHGSNTMTSESPQLAPALANETSYRHWANHLAGLQSNHDATSPVIGACWTEERVVNHTTRISGEVLASLNTVCGKLNVELHETLMYALLRSCTQSNTVQLDVEMHGRDLFADDIDVSASIGWFTGFFRVVFDETKAQGLTAFCQSLRAARIPGQRQFLQSPGSYLPKMHDQTAALAENEPLAILFNYLAGASKTMSEQAGGASFQTLLDTRLRDKASPRSHPIDCVVLDATDGDLEMIWRVDANVLEWLDMPAWQDQFLLQLSSLCTDQSIVDEPPTAIEFTDSGLQADELQQLLDGLD